VQRFPLLTVSEFKEVVSVTIVNCFLCQRHKIVQADLVGIDPPSIIQEDLQSPFSWHWRDQGDRFSSNRGVGKSGLKE
jgi:hypothetical protein